METEQAPFTVHAIPCCGREVVALCEQSFPESVIGFVSDLSAAAKRLNDETEPEKVRTLLADIRTVWELAIRGEIREESEPLVSAYT